MIDSAAVTVRGLIGLCVLVACGTRGGDAEERETPEPPVAEAAPTPEPATPEPTPEPEPEPEPEPLTMPEQVMLPGDPSHDHDTILAGMADSRPTQFKPVGTSSVVFRVYTVGEHTFAFKPPSRGRSRAPSAEVAAYRLGRLLGYDNVLPATLRAIPRPAIRNRMHRRYSDEQTWLDLEESIRWSGRDAVGAAIYWVPDMRDIGLDEPERRSEWAGWIGRGGEAPEGQRALARDLSNVILFDYLVANWDRYSGGNLRVIGPEDSPRVVIRDNDAAFAAPLPDPIKERLRVELEKVERFSRGTVERLRRLDEASLMTALRDERVEDPQAPDAYLLNETQRAGVLERAATALSWIGALIDVAGEDAVLSFD